MAHIVEACVEQGIVVIEPEEAAEEEWLSVLLGVGVGGARYFQACTPSFYNSEQQAIDARAARNLTYSGSLLDYVGYLERWREEPGLRRRDRGDRAGRRRRLTGAATGFLPESRSSLIPFSGSLRTVGHGGGQHPPTAAREPMEWIVTIPLLAAAFVCASLPLLMDGGARH